MPTNNPMPATGHHTCEDCGETLRPNYDITERRWECPACFAPLLGYRDIQPYRPILTTKKGEDV